jgi:predicted HTH domain antitoxin
LYLSVKQPPYVADITKRCLRHPPKEGRSDLSKAVREMVTRGRILFAVERYKKGKASLGKAAELAGLPLGQMMTILTEFGVETRLERDDYLQALQNLKKVW